MELKLSPVGLMVYGAMALWMVAMTAYIARNSRLGAWLFAGGFAITAAAFVLRWIQVQHPPMQNMFEVMLMMGMLIWPAWMFCRRFLDARCPAGIIFIGLLVLFPVGFVFHDQPQKLPPALQSWLFIPHVSSYMLAYMVLFMATVQAGGALACRTDAARWDDATHRMVCLGFPLLSLGLVLGAVWGKYAWGDYWNWDPKEMWSLASFLAFVAYIHFRGLHGRRFIRTNAVLVIIGAVFIILTLLWVNLSRIFGGTLHSYAT